MSLTKSSTWNGIFLALAARCNVFALHMFTPLYLECLFCLLFSIKLLKLLKLLRLLGLADSPKEGCGVTTCCTPLVVLEWRRVVIAKSTSFKSLYSKDLRRIPPTGGIQMDFRWIVGGNRCKLLYCKELRRFWISGDISGVPVAPKEWVYISRLLVRTYDKIPEVGVYRRFIEIQSQ